MLGKLGREVRDANSVLPKAARLGVLGSSVFWGSDSGRLCTSIGRSLATFPELTLITGGVQGVGEAIGRAFWEESRSMGQEPSVFHILPRGFGTWDYGVTLRVGETMLDRREVLARVAPVYIVVEGGPGTAHEARIAREHSATIVPVCRTGGHAEELYSELDCPVRGFEDAWEALTDNSIGSDRLAESVTRIIQGVLN